MRRRLAVLAAVAALAAGCASLEPAPPERAVEAREAELRRNALAAAQADPAITTTYLPDVDSTLYHSRPMLLDASIGEDGARLAFVAVGVRYAGTPRAVRGPASPLLLFYRETETGRVRFARTYRPRVEVDDWDVPVGPVGYHVELEQEATDDPLGEALLAFIPRGALERMAEAREVEVELGQLEVELRRRALEPVRLFLRALERAGLDPSAEDASAGPAGGGEVD